MCMIVRFNFVTLFVTNCHKDYTSFTALQFWIVSLFILYAMLENPLSFLLDQCTESLTKYTKQVKTIIKPITFKEFSSVLR